MTLVCKQEENWELFQKIGAMAIYGRMLVAFT